MRISDWSSDVCSSDLYTDDYIDNQLPETPQRIPSWTTVDLGLPYAFSGETPWLRGLSLQFNALNAFDRDPPRIFDTLASYGNPGYDPENASPIGRLVSIEVRTPCSPPSNAPAAAQPWCCLRCPPHPPGPAPLLAHVPML